MRTHILRTLFLLPLLGIVAITIAMAQQRDYQTFDENVNAKRREIYFWERRAFPFGRIPQGARQNAIEHVESKMRAFMSDGLQSLARWTPIGPFNVGGRIRSIAVHPTDGATLWVAAADGGVWKSTNTGNTWTPVMDFENAIAMGAIAVDPTNPAILFAGTGEMSSNIDAYAGAGMYKSTDGGNSWTGVGLTTVGAFSRVVVHPANPSLVLAGATKNNSGLYRSEDGGATWTRTFTDGVSDVTVNPTNAGEVWIGTMTKGVYRSTDGGRSFSAANNGLGVANLGRTSVQISASNPTILYALIDETLGTGASVSHYSRIYKTTNKGASWTLVFDNAPNFLNLGNPQGWYNNAIGVDPANPDIVLGLGISMVRSGNGGSAWSHQNGNIHPDNHCIAFDPVNPGVVYVGNDGGVYRSVDGGLSWTEKSVGLAVTQFYDFAVDQRTATTSMGGSQDNGTMTTAGSFVSGGDGGYCFYDPVNSSTLYASSQNAAFYRFDNGSGTQVQTGLDPDEQSAMWIAPWTIDKTDPNSLYCALRTIYRSFNRGDEWVPTSAKFTGLGSAIEVSTVDHDVVWAGSDRGEIFVTTNGGSSWLNRTSVPGAPGRAITDFAPSLTDANTVYMTVSGFYTEHVFKSTDMGASWTSIGNGLPDIPFNAIALHPDDANIIYVGSDIGMFITVDGGVTWASYSNGLPRAAVVDLEVHRSSRKLRAATHGRSMWEIDLERPTFDPAITSPAGGEVWMGGTSRTISWVGFQGPIRLELSLDGGNKWFRIGTNLVGPAYRWVVPDTVAAYAVIRATQIDNSEVTATSRTFTITRYAYGGVLATSTVQGVPYGICFDGEYLWASDFSSKTLLKIDPLTLQTVGSIQLQLTGGDSLFTDLAWVSSRQHFFIHKLMNTTAADPGGYLYEFDRTGKQIGRWRSPAAYPIGLVSLGERDPSQPWLFATDRNGSQQAYFFDLEGLDPGVGTATPFVAIPRTNRVELGPRGATNAPQPGKVYQVITDFTGSALQSATGLKLDAQTLNEDGCSLPLTSPGDGRYYNARGIELDPRDSNLWVSDYNGSIYKVASCDGTAPHVPLDPGGSGVGYDHDARSTTVLEQSIPNPAHDQIVIGFTLAEAGDARLVLYSADGRRLLTLAEGRFPAGRQSVRTSVATLPSGAYRYAIEFDNRRESISRTLVVVR